MTAAVGLGILALALQTSDAPESLTNGLPSQVSQLILENMPDAVYAGATATGEEITYVGGLDWKTGRNWGVGAEYRQWSFATSAHDVITHSVIPYAYRELPPLGSLVLRTEIGAGVMWVESATLQADELLVAGIRISGRVELSARFDIVAWTGAIYTGSTDVRFQNGSTRKVKEADQTETGLALRMKL